MGKSGGTFPVGVRGSVLRIPGSQPVFDEDADAARARGGSASRTRRLPQAHAPELHRQPMSRGWRGTRSDSVEPAGERSTLEIIGGNGIHGTVTVDITHRR